MVFFFWLVLFLLAACAFLLLLFLVGREFYEQYRGSRAVNCPENGQAVAVAFDAGHAAATRLVGKPALRLAECTRWPERADCGQQCIADAAQTAPYTQGEADVPTAKAVYHIPVLLAAFAAWALGAVWHSHYLFRAEWMEAVGLSRMQVHQLVWRLFPHLLSLAMPLLFAYGVAAALAWNKRKGFWRGLLTAAIFWAALCAASLGSFNIAAISPELLKLELAYTFMASLLIGAVVGGLSGRLTEQAFAK
jgi:hypothetical protein